jgi:NADH-quinone oxidoreductase subunit N
MHSTPNKIVTLAMIQAAHIKGPHIDWAALSPIVVLAVGALVVLLVGLVRSAALRAGVVPFLSLIALAGAAGTEVWRLSQAPETIVAGALRIDGLAMVIDLLCASAAIAAVILAWRSEAPRSAGHGEFHSLLLFSVMGMAVFVSSQDIITLFLGIELLSIPLYILCAAEYRREGSLESGLKYLIIGSVGSATLVYGLAMIYGATGQTGFEAIAHVLSHPHSAHLVTDPLLLTGVAMVLVGFAFKASVAPFHQWTPDVYQGAPTPITAFMATATKAAAIAVILRFFDVALFATHTTWQPIIAALATATILVGNVGALGQTSLKRLLGYSGVAQAGYMLSGVVVATQLGVSSTVFYLIGYLLMNVAVFAAVHAQELETGNDRISGLAGLGKRSPALAWGITVGMLGLAGIPGTIGFIGKFQLIHALVNGGYGWLAIILVVGAMISLGYYLKVVAAVWMSPASTSASTKAAALTSTGGIAPVAGGSPEVDRLPYPEVVLVGAVFGALTIIFGIIPGPIFHLAAHAGSALGGLL